MSLKCLELHSGKMLTVTHVTTQCIDLVHRLLLTSCGDFPQEGTYVFHKGMANLETRWLHLWQIVKRTAFFPIANKSSGHQCLQTGHFRERAQVHFQLAAKGRKMALHNAKQTLPRTSTISLHHICAHFSSLSLKLCATVVSWSN